MNELTDDERKQVLGELFMDELKAIREGIENMVTKTEFNELKDDVAELKTDMKVVKAAVTDMSNEYGKRLDNLIAAAA